MKQTQILILKLIIIFLPICSCSDSNESHNKPFTYKDIHSDVLTSLNQDLSEISEFPLEDSVLFLDYKVGMSKEQVNTLTNRYNKDGKFRKTTYYLTWSYYEDKPLYLTEDLYYAKFEGLPDNPTTYIIPCSLNFEFTNGLGLQNILVTLIYPTDLFESYSQEYSLFSKELEKKYWNDLHANATNNEQFVDHIKKVLEKSKEKNDEEKAESKRHIENLKESLNLVDERIDKYMNLKYGDGKSDNNYSDYFKDKIWLFPQKMITLTKRTKSEIEMEGLLKKEKSTAILASISYSWVSREFLRIKFQEEKKQVLESEKNIQMEKKNEEKQLNKKLKDSGI